MGAGGGRAQRGRRRAGNPLYCVLWPQVETFFKQCDPNRENLCLYGCSDGTFEVSTPCEEVGLGACWCQRVADRRRQQRWRRGPPPAAWLG